MTRPEWLAILVFLLLGTGAFAQAPRTGNDAKSKAGAATMNPRETITDSTGFLFFEASAI